MAKDYSEDLLIQKSTAVLLEQVLGWKSVYAFDNEALGENGTLGRKAQNEVVLIRHLRMALKRLTELDHGNIELPTMLRGICKKENLPVRLYQYDDRIEISNAGGLYGNARPENFPHMNDYRNNVVAEIMKSFNYVNKFNHGIQEVMDECESNGNPPAVFSLELVTAFLARIMDASTTDSAEQTIKGIEKEAELVTSLNQLVLELKPQVKALILSLEDTEFRISELQLKPLLKPMYGEKSLTFMKKDVIAPSLEFGIIELTHPDNPRHPHQKYRLTEKGKMVLKVLLNDENK